MVEKSKKINRKQSLWPLRHGLTSSDHTPPNVVSNASDGRGIQRVPPVKSDSGGSPLGPLFLAFFADFRQFRDFGAQGPKMLPERRPTGISSARDTRLGKTRQNI